MALVDRLKYSPVANALRPYWHAMRKRVGLANGNSEASLAIWKNLQRLLVDDALLHVSEFQSEFYLAPESHLFLRLIVDGEYEPLFAQLALKHLNPEKDVLDIGANVGFFTCLLAKHVGQGRVLAVEPTFGAHRRLIKNVTHNKLADKVICFQGAVSDRDGEIEIAYIDGKEEFASVGAIDHPAVDKSAVVRQVVPTTTLDTLVNKHRLRPGFIKVDVEGFEGQVFAGASKTLREHRPVILSELSDELLKSKGYSADQIIRQIQDLGYEVIDPVYPDLAPGERPFGDILAIPNDQASAMGSATGV